MSYSRPHRLSTAMAYATLSSLAATAQEKKLVEEKFFGPSSTDLLTEQFNQTLSAGGYRRGETPVVSSQRKIRQSGVSGEFRNPNEHYRADYADLKRRRYLRNMTLGAHASEFSSMYGNYYTSEGESTFAAWSNPKHPLPEWAMRVAVNFLYQPPLNWGTSVIAAVVAKYNSPIFYGGDEGTMDDMSKDPAKWLDYMLNQQVAESPKPFKPFKLQPYQEQFLNELLKESQ